MKNTEKDFQELKTMCPAVLVQNGFKSYDNGVPVLSNFNMTVQRGAIYGLLGASGCGKTSILSCIVGLKRLDNGKILVFGTRPGTRESGIPGKTIGYMPQEIALYEKFSIKEILHYFGRIYDMTHTEIIDRVEFLTNCLDLPGNSRIINTLSGGQQRRTSLAVAMIHEPPLLILDEPTVGVDPLIRENIWKYLISMVEERKTTVIITTHYIEEARQSNTVGIIRNGRLLVEKPPQLLLEEHNTNLLEDIVLKLFKKDNTNNVLDSSESDTNNCSDEIKDTISETSFYSKGTGKFEAQDRVVGLKYKSRSPDDNTLFWKKRELINNSYRLSRNPSIVQIVNHNVQGHVNKILSLVVKNFILLWRNPLSLAFILGIPTIHIILMNIVFSGVPKDTNFGLVNNELKIPYVESCATRKSSCLNGNMSCGFIQEFSNAFSWNEFSSEAAALKSVQLGESWGYVSIPGNFTEHMKHKLLWKNFITNETVDGSTISLRMDMSDPLKTRFMMTSLYGNYLNFVKKIVSDCGGDPTIVELPLNFKAVYGSLDTKFVEYFQPAQLLLCLFPINMVHAVTIVLDRKAGTLNRTLVAGVNFIHIFIAVMISQLTLIILQIFICLGVAVLVFGFVVQGMWVLVFLIAVLTAICGLSFGMFFGTICSHEVEAIFLLLSIYMPSIILSGTIWPLETVNPWFRIICSFLPLTLPIQSFRSIVSRGWGFEKVWVGFASITGWISVLFILTVFLNRSQK